VASMRISHMGDILYEQRVKIIEGEY